MPKWKIIIRNISDTSHDDPAVGCVKQIITTAPTLEDVQAVVIREITRQVADPQQHYTWTIKEISG